MSKPTKIKKPTDKQVLGDIGEKFVIANSPCPKCKRQKTLKQLRTNFRCADLICDFCGYLAQVKATTVKDVTVKPVTIQGAGWKPQKDRMDSGIYFPLFIVTISPDQKQKAIFYLSADLQDESVFLERNELKPTAKKAGWKGFRYRLGHIADRLVRIK